MKNTRRIAVSLILALAAAQAQENYSLWSGLREYTLNTSASGANVTETVTNFPVVIRLGAADSAVFSAAKPDGADLRFSKPNGVRLPHQIESWNAAGRSAVIWVRADSVRGNTALQPLRMHWGRAEAADSSRGASVFDTAQGFVAVWHMTGSGDVPDATANGLTAVGPSGAVPGTAAGSIGPGRSFNGSTQHFSVADNPRLAITQAITMSLWVNAANWNGSTRLLQKSPASDNNSSQYGLRDDSNDQLALNLNGAHTATGTTYPSPPTGEWHLIHGTYDGTTATQYQNGVAVASGTLDGPINTGPGDLKIAMRPDGTSFLTGLLDEVRLQRVARGAAWIRLEYENQKSGQTLVQLASQVSIRGASPVSREEAFTAQASGDGVLFRLPSSAVGASIHVVDMRGRAVWEGTFAPGSRELSWGARVPAGLYAARLTVPGARGRSVVAERRIAILR